MLSPSAPEDFLLMQRLLGNQAVQRYVLRQQAKVIHRCGPEPCNCSAEERARKEGQLVARLADRTAAKRVPPPPAPIFREDDGADQSRAQAVAEEVYDALDWYDEETRMFNALSGHNEAMRQAIRWAFSDKYDESIAGYLDSNLSGDELVQAHALLSHPTYHGLETALALCLIPIGTRDDELWRIFNSLNVDGRKRLEEEYNKTFGRAGEGSRYSHHIGEGSLKEDLEEDLSGTDEDKALAMLDHDLTSAEKLYLDTRGEVGTSENAAIARLRDEWDKGFANFASFESDWDRYVKNGDWDNSGETLYDAMDEEFSGEDWKVVKAILKGAEAAAQGGFYASQASPYSEEQMHAIEEIQLDVERAALRAAADNPGTGEEHAFRAVGKMQEIWNRRLTRVKPDPPTQPGNPALYAEYERAWEQEKAWASDIIRSEMDEGWGDREKALLLLEGNLTPADELYIAKLNLDNDMMLAAVDKAWGQGKIGELNRLAAQERRGSNGQVVRPVYDPMYDTIPVSSGMPFRRMMVVLQTNDSVRGGIDRLKLELDEGNDDSDLQRAYEFLTKPHVRDGLMAEVVDGFAARYLGDERGETNKEKFLKWAQSRYESGNAYWNFLDKLKPATDARERLERAVGRWEANVGWGDAIAHVLTNPFTQEDTIYVAGESLVRLARIVEAENASSTELNTMLAITGKKSLEELAEYEYNQFVDRLEAVRALKRQVAEALAMLAEIAVDLAITVLTGGAAAGAVLASLASTIAGMMVREAMLGRYYDVQSMQNLQALTVALAGAGFGALGTKAFKNIPADELAKLGFVEGFLREAGAAAVETAGTKMTGAMFDNKLPSAEDIAATMISIGGKGLGARAKGRLASQINDQMSGVQRLRTQIMSNVAGQVVGSVSDETAELVRTGDRELNAADIALRFGRGISGAMLKGVAAGVGEHGAEKVAAARDRRRQGAGAEGEEEEEGAATTRPGEEGAEPGDLDEEARKAQELERIGDVSAETRQMLEENDALRKAFANHPMATKLLKLCASPCLPEHATDAQLAQLERMLDVMEAAGFPVREDTYQAQLKQWFHRPENMNDLSRALNDLDATFQVHRYRGEIDAMATRGHGANMTPPAAAELDAAVDRVRQGAATEDDLRLLLSQAVVDYRAAHLAEQNRMHTAGERAREEQGGHGGDWTRLAELNAQTLKGECGVGRDLSLVSLQSLVAGTPDTITMHRYQAADLGFGAQHGFAIVVFPRPPGQPPIQFIVDPTVAQFLNRHSEHGYTGGNIREQTGGANIEGMRAVRDILRDGFTLATPETAAQYMIALGADERQAQAAAGAILAGQSAVQTDLVTGNRIQRPTNAPPGAVSNLDIDNYTQPLGGDQWRLVNEINELLASGNPPVGTPLWQEMTALRDHLNGIAERLASVQPMMEPVTSTQGGGG